MSKKILKLGWEFPPHYLGGLGIACCDLIKSLSYHEIDIIFLLPYRHSVSINRCVMLHPRKNIIDGNCLYTDQLMKNVNEFAQFAVSKAHEYSFDIIHAHEWMSFPAAIQVKKYAQKPLVIHFHATEFDRKAGKHLNKEILAIESYGARYADKVIAVSEYTKRIIIEQYAINADKIAVIHNAPPLSLYEEEPQQRAIKQWGPVILFLGRLTAQKGPDYFIAAAQRVLDYRNDVTFIITGDGDMMPALVQYAYRIGILDKILFTGFLQGAALRRMYQLADIYVMPSISEPFGLTALEAMYHGLPIIISENAGVTEIAKDCIVVNVHDIKQVAHAILMLLENSSLRVTMGARGRKLVKKLHWHHVAKQFIELYTELCDQKK